MSKALYVDGWEIKTTKDSEQDSTAKQTHLPLGIIVRLQGAFVCPGEHHQAAVVPVNVLHGRPRTDDAIAGSEGEVVQVLVQGVAGCLLA